jgi:protein TonB
MTPSLAQHGRVGAPRPFEPRTRRFGVAWAVMILFHLGLGYALLSGLGPQAVKLIQRPLEATIIEAVKPPEPPPAPVPPPPRPIAKPQAPAPAPAPRVEPPPRSAPPPDVQPPVAEAPAVEAVTAAPLAQAPAAAPVSPPAPQRLEMSVACPTQVAPEVPRKAADEGVGGVVRAQIRIQGGTVTEVQILSGPRVFHDSVRKALSKYRCVSHGDQDVTATQDFKFQLD